jgi:hypothetical protein
MTRDPDLVYRILLAIEAKKTTAPAPLQIPGADEQDVLNHLALLHEEGLYSGSRPHRSSSTDEVDQALVRDLTRRGREYLQQIKQEQQELSARSSAWGNSWDSSSGRPFGAQAQGAAGNVTVATAPPGEPPQEDIRSQNRILVILQIDALLLVLFNEKQRLLERRLNDDPELREVEEFEEQVKRLRTKALDVERGTATPESGNEAARSFGDYVRSWFDKHHDKVLTDGFETLNGAFKIAVFLSATNICASLGVHVTVAAAISGALIGGQTVVEAIKAVTSIWKKKNPPDH